MDNKKCGSKVIIFFKNYGVYFILSIIATVLICWGYKSEYAKKNTDLPDYVIDIKDNNLETDASRKNVYIVSENDNYESEIPKNVGFSLFASAIAALILDTSITKKQNKKNKINKTRLFSDLRRECEGILPYVMLAFHDCYGIDDKRRTYSEWIEGLFNENDFCENNKSEVGNFIIKINEVKHCAEKTLDYCKIFYYNDEITTTDEDDLNTIISKCDSINMWSTSKKHHKYLLDNFNSLKDYILKFFPDLKAKFEQGFNYDDLSNWG